MKKVGLKLGVLLFEGFELLDVFGPLEMLGQIEDLSIELVSVNKGPVFSAQGPAAYSQTELADERCYDILLIPGGIGTRKEVENADVIKWISNQASKAKYITSVCTGSTLLAKAGVLKNKKATSNKLAFNWVSSQCSETEWIPKARWIKDGNIYTSAGVSAGIDMALALISDLWGSNKANDIADFAEYQWNPDSSNDVFSDKYGLS